MTSNYRPRRAMLLLFFLTFLNLLNFVDRQLITSLAPLIVKDLGFSDTQIGLLAGLYFVLFYSFIGMFMGAIADRFHRPYLMAGGLFLWSFLTAASGFARSFWQLGAARLFIGVGEASLTPASMSMLSDTFPPEKRGFASGVYYIGIPLGVGVSLIIAGTVGTTLGWRNCFYILGALGVLVSFGLIFLRDPPRGAMEKAAPVEPAASRQSFWEILGDIARGCRRSPALLLTIVGSAIVVFSMQASTMEQLWLVRERGYSQQSAALKFGVLFLFSGTVGNYLGGALSDWFHKRWSGGRMLFLGCVFLVVLPFAITFRFYTPDTLVFYLCAFMYGASLMMIYGPCFATVQDLVPIRIRSTTVALLILGHNLIGTAPGAFTAGKLCDTFRDMGMEQPMTWGSLVVSLTALIAVPMFFYAAWRYRRDMALLAAEEALRAEACQ